MTNQHDFTEREWELIQLLSERFPEHAMDARIVMINRLEGGTEETLRLTLDDTVSTDFARSRIAGNSQSIEALVDEAEAELNAPGARIGP